MKEFKLIAASWARSFGTAVITTYLAGVTEPKTILYAGTVAVLPVVLRWLNPNDQSFGRK